MKISSTALATLALFAAVVNGSPMMRQEGEASSCTLSGTYKSGTDISSCSTLTIGKLTVPAGVTLDLSKAKTGANIKITGTVTFGQKKWAGPLVLLSGSDLTVSGTGTLDGQGSWYWKQGQSITRPIFFRMNRVTDSTVSGFMLKNMPYRTFSILNSKKTTISGLTLDASAGNNLAKNTDGFDLSGNDGVTISNNKIYNQDDLNSADTVSGLTVKGNTIINSVNGLRIKTIVDLKGLVSNVKYTDNKLSNVKNAIVIHSDYSKSKGGYTGKATSAVNIKGITISGLSGTATNLYDIVANSKVVSEWSFSGITVKASKTGKCSGQPSTVK
ncbi:hypothetical protein BBP00_00008857, partial [Phytophthora kernoviae]